MLSITSTLLLIPKFILNDKLKWLNKKVERTQLVVSLCEELGVNILDTSFDSIYSHALVEYGIEYPNKEMFLTFFALDKTREYVKQHLYKKPAEELHNQLSGLLHTGTGKIFLKLKTADIQRDDIIEEYDVLTQFIEKYRQQSLSSNLSFAKTAEEVTQVKELVEDLKSEVVKVEHSLSKLNDIDLVNRLEGIEKEMRDNSLFIKLLIEKFDELNVSENVVNQIAEKIYNIGSVNQGVFIAEGNQYLKIENATIQGIKKTTKHCLASFPTQDIFEGRETELQKLHENLFENHHTHIVSVKGIGGVGKSALAREYFIRKHTEFDFAIFLEGQIDIFSTLQHYALLDNLELTKKIDSIPKNKDQNKNILELIENVLLNLQTDDKKEQTTKLLVIDDVPTNDTQILNRLVKGGWQIITTSRENIRNTSTYELFELTLEDAQYIFARYYFDTEVIQSSSEDTKIIEKIVGRLNYHVLAIELVAKNANYLGWDLEKLNQILADKGLDISPYADIETQHNKQKNIEHLFSYLLEIFPLDELDHDELYLLQQYSVIPDEIIDSLLWENLLGKTSDYWQHISHKLHKKGWLNMASTNKENGFRLHALLAEIVRNKTLINIDVLLKGLYNKICHENFYLHNSKEVYLKYFPIVDKIKYTTKDIVFLLKKHSNIIAIYRDIGWLLKNYGYEKLSIEYLELALEIAEQKGTELEVAQVKTAISDVYRMFYINNIGADESYKLNALKYAEDAYEYFKKNNVMDNMHNVGVTLALCIIDFDKARIEIAKSILEASTEDCRVKSKWELAAQGIANMGYLLYHKGEAKILIIKQYEEALELYYSKRHLTPKNQKVSPTSAMTWHSNLSKLYRKLDNIDKSNYHKNEAEKIENSLGKGDS